MKSVRSLLAQWPTALTLVALGGIVLWGRANEWKAPKFSALLGKSGQAEKDDWCEKHNVPDSQCIACHPELTGANPKDWCKEHGVPESKCPICHPEEAGKAAAADWCKEHKVPMSLCTICNPKSAARSEAPAPTQPAPHVSSDPHTKPIPDPRTCMNHLFRVQFASAETVGKAGIQTAAAREQPVVAYVTCPATVAYNQTRLARLATRVPGTVWRLEKQIGDSVKKGEVLALVDAVEVGRAKAELLQATTQRDARNRTLEMMKPIASSLAERQVRDAETALREARIRVFNAQQALMNLGLPLQVNEVNGMSEEQLKHRLRFLGLPTDLAKSLEKETTTANLIPVTAPFAGKVLSCSAVAGEVVDSGKPFFVMADVNHVWIMLDVRAEDIGSVKLGQEMTFFPSSGEQKPVKGTVSWISTEADEKTRTVHVSAEVPNEKGGLRAHTFGRGEIRVRTTNKAVVVPEEAVQWEGCCHVVFVQKSPTIFETRKVQLGVRRDGFTEITVGVRPGEVVATTGSHLLKSEILKYRLGGDAD